MLELRKNRLYEPVKLNGRNYITSHVIHRDIKPTDSISATNKAIRRSETYLELLDNKHILELTTQHPESIRESILESLVKSNSYNPVVLIDPVAQKALEHHFKKTSSQAVHSARENATLSFSGIELEELDRETLLLFKSVTDARKAKRIAEATNRAVTKLEERVSYMDGDTGYCTVLAFARSKKIKLPAETFKLLGQRAKKTADYLGCLVGRVPDERYGKVNSYPREMLEDIFSDYFRERSSEY